MPSRPTIRVYVDGQNLFRRALKGTSYKWLDIVRLCQQVLPRYDVTRIKYFTALVRPSPHDLLATERQARYLNALASHPAIEIHLGQYRRDVVRMPLHPWSLDAGGAPETVLVKRTREKGSDVNLATHLLWDALHREADAYAVLTNDSDLVTPVRMLRLMKGCDVGVISPTEQGSQHLSAVASWQRHLRRGVLAECQLPPVVETLTGRLVVKPEDW